MKTRDELALLCNNLGLVGTAVEVGVDNGYFAKENLKNWHGAHYIFIDPWARVPGYVDCPELDDKELQKRYEAVVRCFAPDPRVSILRAKSLDAVKKFEDGSLDWVYLDAIHEYETVKADIEAWFPKVKMGGVFSGHDYTACKPGVVKAVNEFLARTQYNVNLTNEDHGFLSWWVIK